MNPGHCLYILTTLPSTIYDIAKAANVSIATVSRVFNNSGTVRSTTRERVLTIAEKMGFHPHAYAQGLASKRKNTILMLVPMMSNYFFTEILMGAQQTLSDSDTELTIFNINQELGAFQQVSQILKRRFADGYLLASLHLPENELESLQRFNVPISLLDDYSPLYDSVSFNNDEGGFMATGYLIRKGHRKIAFISGRTSSIPVSYRIDGYKRALGEAGIGLDESLIVSGDDMIRDGFTERAGYEAMLKLLRRDDRPEAVFCSSDIKAIGAQKAMREWNVRLPMISYDNLSISEYIGLTTIHQPMAKMGFEATKVLLDRIDHAESKLLNLVHQPELIIRESSEV
ncbi:MAG: LacI family transcriptional regulator [Balneolaceae bacterium]|nr:MAG: LacI family transcriptional regulator [Balneolaceae bacterium]